ncbi:MAG: ABC transporter substrate-binding protein [Desulfobacteraceae bacterium]|nr:ABC transporter substrate-binding protein [Desulfobacteraceae bacterium]
MKFRFDLTNMAITAVLAAIAFFLVGCPPKPPVAVRPEKPVLDEFYLAEQDVKAGNYDAAIEKYELYLKEHPKGDKSRQALYRVATIYTLKHAYEKALSLYERVAGEYPAHQDFPIVKYDIANTYYRLGAYEKSRDLATEWLQRYPTNPIKGEVLLLLGKTAKALGDNPKAFYWYLKASEAAKASPELMSEVVDRIIGLLKESPMEDLQAMAASAAGSDYLPHIYYQMAIIYLEGNQLDDAKSAAMALVRSTPDQYWVSIGRHILERIEEELSVKMGAIGCLLPLSGPFAIYGQEVLNGIQLGMGMWAESEGYQDLELVIKDTGGETETAVSAVEELAIEEKVMAIIGPLVSKPTLAAAKKAQELGVPIITLTQKEGVTVEGEMVFRNFLTPSKEIQSILERAVNDLGLTRFAVLYPNNPYGLYFMNLFWDQAEELGGTIRAVESYNPEETDFAVEIKKMVGLHYPRPQLVVQTYMQMKSMEWENEIEERQPSDEEPEPIVDFDAIFLPGNPEQVALIAPQFPFYNIFGVPLLGTSLWQDPELIKTAGDYVQGAIFPTGFYAKGSSNGVREFVALYEENFESEPGLLAASGYDTIRFIKNVMIEGMIRTRRDFQYRLAHHESFYGVTGKISFDEQGEVEKIPTLLTVSGKRFKVLSPGQ